MILIAKIIFNNCKRILFIAFFCIFCLHISAQSKKVKEANRKKEALTEEQSQAAQEQYEKNLQHQYDIQSKATKKRMQDNKKSTDKYYKKKLGQSFFQRIFKKKRPK
jgi:Tfp pilus assembly protein PilN